MRNILEYSEFNPNEKFDLMCIGYKKSFGPDGPGTGDRWNYGSYGSKGVKIN